MTKSLRELAQSTVEYCIDYREGDEVFITPGLQEQHTLAKAVLDLLDRNEQLRDKDHERRSTLSGIEYKHIRLKTECDQLKARLDAAEDVIRYYVDADDFDYENSRGFGKRAREYFGGGK